MRSTLNSISLIICTYRRPLHISRLLSSLRNLSLRPDETLVVDGSPDEATEREGIAVQSDGALPGLVYYKVPPEQRGLTRQRNYGIEHAHGSIITLLDDDTLPNPHYFQAIAACFERHPDAGGVGGYITNEVV